MTMIDPMLTKLSVRTYGFVCIFTYFVPQVSINIRTASAGIMLPLSAVSRENGGKGRLPCRPERTPLNGL
jgi:hypothetical protein